jgi:hypothetical protein
MFQAGVAEIGRSGPPPTGREANYERGGMVFVGGPNEVADRIRHLHELLGHSRQILQMDIGGMPQSTYLKGIELFLAPRCSRRSAKRSDRRKRPGSTWTSDALADGAGRDSLVPYRIQSARFRVLLALHERALRGVHLRSLSSGEAPRRARGREGLLKRTPRARSMRCSAICGGIEREAGARAPASRARSRRPRLRRLRRCRRLVSAAATSASRSRPG